MADVPRDTASASGRRPPPPFRLAAVDAVTSLSPRMAEVTLRGDGLESLVPDDPAASVRLLLPEPGDDGIEIPEWNGNEFLRRDGGRPVIRTFTPRRGRPGSLDLDVVIHDGGAASAWVQRAAPGAPVALSGPGRGYRLDPEASGYLLAGDETAIPAISQLLEVIPPEIPVRVMVELSHADARQPLPEHPQAAVSWHDLTEAVGRGGGLLNAIGDIEIEPGLRIWAAGEAAAMFRIRRHLFDERGVARSRAAVRGYWKAERPSGQA
jgi:NADPH-dependent ferric siderophore reductase